MYCIPYHQRLVMIRHYPVVRMHIVESVVIMRLSFFNQTQAMLGMIHWRWYSFVVIVITSGLRKEHINYDIEIDSSTWGNYYWLFRLPHGWVVKN